MQNFGVLGQKGRENEMKVASTDAAWCWPRVFQTWLMRW